MPFDAEGAEHDSEWQIERFEDGPLLDVELEVGSGALEFGPCVERSVEVDAVRGERVGKRNAVAVRELA